MAIEFISTSLKNLFAAAEHKKAFARLVKNRDPGISLSLPFFQLLHSEGAIRNLAIMFYILYESVQIVITASSLGIPVPQVLVDLLDTLKINSSANRNICFKGGYTSG